MPAALADTVEVERFMESGRLRGNGMSRAKRVCAFVKAWKKFWLPPLLTLVLLITLLVILRAIDLFLAPARSYLYPGPF